MTCFDIPGAYLKAETDKDVIVVIEGPLEELMVKFGPSFYRKYVTTKLKGKPLIYVKMHKALYGIICSALLFYKNIVKDLDDYGFETNEYDPCVANNTVNGYQMTVFLYVGDFKMYHKGEFEINIFVTYLQEIYGVLQASRIKVHN